MEIFVYEKHLLYQEKSIGIGKAWKKCKKQAI